MLTLNNLEFRRAFDAHPHWLLTLYTRNFNRVTAKQISDDSQRLSIRAGLAPDIESPECDWIFIESGLDFQVVFEDGFEQYFDDGAPPRMLGSAEIVEFVRRYSRSSPHTLRVIHQQGGDPSTADFDIVGYYRDGIDACEVFRRGAENLIKGHPYFPPIADESRAAVALALCYLADETHWQQFLKTGRIYVHDKDLPAEFHKWLVLNGLDMVQELIGEAENSLHLLFPEFAKFGQLSASRYLV